MEGGKHILCLFAIIQYIVVMCLAVPGKIIEIVTDAPALRMARISFAGVVKDICIEWLPEASVGDYVLAHAGIALTMLDAKEAGITLDVFEQWAQHLDAEKIKPARQ
jgi:hydrogenase expression/formation protein HypC